METNSQASNPASPSDSYDRLLCDLAKVYNRNAPLYAAGPKHTKSVETRLPKFYDMHLHKDLRLKKIVFMDSIPENLAAAFDKCVQELPRSSTDWPKFDSQIEFQFSADIQNEADLVKRCARILGGPCAAMASGLQFKKHWEPIFAWSETPAGPVTRTQGIADGFLHISADFVGTLSSDDQAKIKCLYDYGLSNFAIWEFKSLRCGPKVLEEFPKLEGDFQWHACQERSEDDQKSERCDYSNQTHRVLGRLTVTGRRTGPDSDQVLEILKERPPRPEDLDSRPSGSVGVHTTLEKPPPRSEDRNLKRKSSSDSAGTHKTLEKPPPRSKARNLKRKNPSDSFRTHKTLKKPPPRSAARKLKRKSRSLSLEKPDGPKRRARRDGPQLVQHEEALEKPVVTSNRNFLKEAHALIQQAWAEATVDDVTYIIFSYGNEEYIGIRHRESQTLYLSRSIKPNSASNPTHFKLQMAIFIVSFNDAVNRSEKLDRIRTAQSLDIPSHWQLSFDREYEFPMNLARTSKLGNKKKTPTDEELELDAELLESLTECQSLSLRFHKGQTLAVTCRNDNTWCLQRGSKPSDSILSGDTSRLFIDLESNIGGQAYAVCLGQPLGSSGEVRYCRGSLVLKMAKSSDEKKALLKEYKNHKALLGAGASVVRLFGLFSCIVRKKDKRYFLLMENGGQSIDIRLASQRAKMLVHLQKHEKIYKAALASFHDRNVAHKYLKDGHILMDVAKNRVNIISLSKCVKFHSKSNANLNLKVVNAYKLEKYLEQDRDTMESIFNLQASQVVEESGGNEEGTADWVEPDCDPMEPVDEDIVDVERRESEVHDAHGDAQDSDEYVDSEGSDVGSDMDEEE